MIKGNLLLSVTNVTNNIVIHDIFDASEGRNKIVFIGFS
jgi:hypothetical protein